MAGKGNTVSKAAALVRPFAEQLGLEVWDVSFVKEGTERYLRVFIDKAGGVSIDDCVDLSHLISKPLDEADLIHESYTLEVSSPGIERELVQDAHFLRYIGSPVLLRTIRPIDGVRDFSGRLLAYADGFITVGLQGGGEVSLQKKEIAYVRLDDFNIDDFKQEL